jgi:hypothetical protein
MGARAAEPPAFGWLGHVRKPLGFATSTSSREAKIKKSLSRVQAVAASGISLSRRQKEGPEPYVVLTELLIEVGRAAIAQGNVMVLIHVDEIQNITDENALSQLLIALGNTLAYEQPITAPGGVEVARSLPIAVYLTGLPDFADMTDARKGATFTRRFKTTVLAAIDDDDFASALQPFIINGWPVADDLGGITRRTWKSWDMQGLVSAAPDRRPPSKKPMEPSGC